MFVDRSGPTAHVKMASPSPSSQCSDVTDFSMSDELDLDSESSPECSPILDSDSLTSPEGSTMVLGTSSAEYSG